VQFKDELISQKFPADSGFEASYRFQIEGAPPAALAIVIERPDLYTITCNGRPVTVAPGAWWLDEYQIWYEIPAIADADNADLLVVTIMLGLFALLLLLPVIPGLNRLPHGLKVYRVIWRDWYRDHAEEVAQRPE
jgi:hypothetical protein